MFASLEDTCTVSEVAGFRLRFTTTDPLAPTIGCAGKASCTVGPGTPGITWKEDGQPSISIRSARPSPFKSAALVGSPNLSNGITSYVGVNVPSPFPARTCMKLLALGYGVIIT